MAESEVEEDRKRDDKGRMLRELSSSSRGAAFSPAADAVSCY